MRRLFVLAALFALAVASPAHAVSHYGVYDGLFPARTQPQPGPAITGADLIGKHIVIVPSRNFNWYADWWMRQFDPQRGADAQARRTLFGVSRDMQAHTGQVADPRAIADQFVQALSPYVASVSSAEDLAAAHAQGADYIVVVDYFMTATMMGRLRSEAGLYVLDNSLRQVFNANGTSNVRFSTGGLAVGDAQAQAEQDSLAASVNALMPPIIADIQNRLGPPHASD